MIAGMINTSSIRITPEVLALIAELDEFKGAWRALGTLAPDRLNALRRIATIESIGSSTRIEGSKLSDHEVEALLRNIEIRKLDSRDAQEVAGYGDVIETINASWRDIPLSENTIKQLHRDLLMYSSKDSRHRGEYKVVRNDVGAFDANGKLVGVVFETPSPFDTPLRMAELLKWVQESRQDNAMHALLVIAVFVVVFLAIHPFQDGNGRLSRVLTTLLLLQAGYAYVPYASLEAIIEETKESYYLALRQTQSTIQAERPDWQPWLLFFLRSLVTQKRRLEVKMEREQRALSVLSDLAVAIVEYARQQGKVSNRDIVGEVGASPNTVKATLKSLVNKGILTKHGAGRSTFYTLSSL